MMKQTWRYSSGRNSVVSYGSMNKFIFAANGKDVPHQLEKHADVNVLLNDINMAEMEGFTLIGKLNEFSLLIKAMIVNLSPPGCSVRPSGRLLYFNDIFNFTAISETAVADAVMFAKCRQARTDPHQ